MLNAIFTLSKGILYVGKMNSLSRKEKLLECNIPNLTLLT